MLYALDGKSGEHGRNLYKRENEDTSWCPVGPLDDIVKTYEKSKRGPPKSSAERVRDFRARKKVDEKK